jgi:hypothetical protein
MPWWCTRLAAFITSLGCLFTDFGRANLDKPAYVADKIDEMSAPAGIPSPGEQDFDRAERSKSDGRPRRPVRPDSGTKLDYDRTAGVAAGCALCREP